MPGFDSAATTAIREAGTIGAVMMPPDGEDSMRVEVRLSTDSIAGSRRLVAGVLSATAGRRCGAASRQPAGGLSRGSEARQITTGEVVLRFVVDRQGEPAMETIEVVRASGLCLSQSRAGCAAAPAVRAGDGARLCRRAARRIPVQLRGAGASPAESRKE